MATFADFLATGSGLVEFRLVIEGCGTIFVTSPTMETLMADGRVVVRGLKREGISIDESAYIAGATLNLKLSSLQITETDGPSFDAATRAFSGFAAASTLTFLNAAIASTDTAAVVRDLGPLTIGRVVHIGTEAWTVTGADGLTDTVFMTRGAWRTTPQAFAIAVPGPSHTTIDFVEITDQPANFAGRRVWLYGHGTSELTLDTSDDNATGYLLWRGVLAANPELSDSRTWSLPMQSRLALFDAEIGKAADGGTALRGAYYSALTPLSIGFNLRAGASESSAFVSSYSFFWYGFAESQADFCSQLTQALATDATLISWGVASCLSAQVTDWGLGTGTWDLFYTTPAASPVWLNIEGGSGVDGGFDGSLQIQTTGRFGPVSSVVASTSYRCGWSPTTLPGGPLVVVPPGQARKIPRASYAPASATGGTSDAAHALWPLGRFYLDFASAASTWGTIEITPPSDGSGTAPAPISARSLVYGGSAGYVQISDTTIVLPPFGAAGTWQPTFALATYYGPLVGGAVGCNLAEFMQSIVDLAPSTANLGGPFVTGDDVADWTSVVVAATTGIAGLQRRIYSFAKPKKLIDVLTEEWKLHGLYPCLDIDGKIAVKPIPASGSSELDFTIDYTVHAPDDDFGKMRLAPDGLVSTVEVKGGYVPADDKWNTLWTFIALGNQAVNKSKGQKLSIAPFARPYAPVDSDGGDLPAIDAQRLVASALRLFGRQYYYVDLPVTMLAHRKRIGDELLVTIRQLPYAGARAQNTPGAGMTNVRAFVVGRSWKYGDSPSGTMTLLMAARNTSGYTPAAWVLSASGSGTAWTLTVEAAHYGPRSLSLGAPADASFFSAGFKVRLREWDSESLRTAHATVVSVVGNVISLTFDSAWDGWSGVQTVLGFDSSTTAGLATGQRAFCYLADIAGRIVYSDATADPFRIFA